MDEIWNRFVEDFIREDFIRRLDGPMHFRFIVQPLMAIVFAAIDGIKDAKAGKPAYGWAVFTSPEHRKELLKDGWMHFGKIFILAIILDVIYQIKVHHAFFPVETLLTALVLAVVPYFLLRGPVNRIVRLFKK
jgi:hypothetical protein